MHTRKIVPLMVLFVVVFLLAPVSAVKNVVLVSDNPADMAIAKAVVDTTDGTLVVSPWGAYDDKTLQKVLSLKPGSVVIIGGSVAVPEEYRDVLTGKGINVTRMGGKDRFETSDLAPGWLVDNGYTLKGNAYILNGWDEGSILYTLQNDPNALIMVVNPHHDLVNAIHEKSGLTEKMASAGTYGRSVYVYPTLVDRDNENSSPCPNCQVMEADEAKAISLSVARLRELSRRVPDEGVREGVLEKASLAEKLASRDEFEKAREALLQGFGMAYHAIATGKPEAAESSSGTNG